MMAAVALLATNLALAYAAVAQQSLPDSDAILQHLNQAISWYRRVQSLDVTAGQPSDTFYVENARNSAAQALQLAFQSASAEAAILESNKNKTGASAGSTGNATPEEQQQGIAKALANVADRISQSQSQIDELNQEIAK